MKVLTVCSYNKRKISPFVREQVNSLRKRGVEIDYFKIQGKGIIGYLKNLPSLFKEIKTNEYDLLHAHYGLSGLLSVMQPYTPVVVTYHGSDVHGKLNRLLSKFTTVFTKYNILTNTKQIKQLNLKSNYSVIPCGIDTNLFVPLDKYECREKMGFRKKEKLVLFSSSFSREVKNYPLAKDAINQLEDVRLLELKCYSREEVALLINAVDMVLITSFSETGPLIVKEALACNTPVISTDVGDVKVLIQDLNNCYLTTFEPADVAQKIQWVLDSNKKCESRIKIERFELQNIAMEVTRVYQNVLEADSD